MSKGTEQRPSPIMTRSEPLAFDRRSFLAKGSAVVGATAAGLAGGNALAANPGNLPPHVPEWSKVLGPSVDDFPYGKPSDYEKHVVRRSVDWLTATRESSINFTPLYALDGFVTPNGLCFERHHGGAAEVDPEDQRLMIHGLVDKPLIFTMDELKRFPRVSRFHFLECAANGGMEWRGSQLNGVQYTHGMIHCVQWTGIPLKIILEEAGVKPGAKWLLIEGADSAGMNRSLPMEKALDDCLLAFSQNGERLRPEQGYPLRLVVPGYEGNMWVKWLRRIEVGDQPWHTREETSKCTDLLSDGKARYLTWEMEAKSVLTNPCPENPVMHKGFNVASGLAWSGRGSIKRVDVSVDGGKNWKTARLEGPVMPQCLTRFYFDWDWDGGEALLQSRAIDDTGYVQPTYAALQKARGVNSIYHNNGIQTWLVNKTGEVENVRLG